MEVATAAVRFGILCNQPRLATWQHRAVQALLAVAHTSLALVIRLESSRSEEVTLPSHLLWRGYLKWGYKPVGLQQASEALPPAPLLSCSALAGSGPGQPVAATDLAEIASYNLDFILSFVDDLAGGQLAAGARLGIWAFRFGKQPSHPVSFWEIYSGELLTTAKLYQFSAESQAVVLQQGFFQTKRHSPSRTADDIYEECAHWPADGCRRLRAGIVAMQGISAALPGPGHAAPTNAEMLAFAVRLARHKLGQLYRTLLVADQWNIGVVNRPIEDFLQPASLQGVAIDTPVLPNRHVFYADCFARQEASEPVVYFERYDYRVRRGTIARLSYPWQPAAVPAPVLQFPFHLSYPFLHGPYCLPEAWITQSIRLYDLRAPVTDPAAGHVLLPVPGVDSTLLEYQGRYWLFYTRADRGDMLNLFIAYADALHGPWHEHPKNPVKTDIRSARPAGPFFEVAGKLYRPAQDCARAYGYGLAIQEVLMLTTTAYAEQEVAHLTSLHPDYPAGMHTIAALDATHTLIDFKRGRFIPMATLLAGWGMVSGLRSWVKGWHQPRASTPLTLPG